MMTYKNDGKGKPYSHEGNLEFDNFGPDSSFDCKFTAYGEDREEVRMHMIVAINLLIEELQKERDEL
jgi:hypothetical protein